MAASLSTGDAATSDRSYAMAVAGQIAAGDTTDYSFETLAVTAYPIDGGTTNFIAFETLRSHDAGYVFRAVELYHRDAVRASWKATVSTYLNDNTDFPQLLLNGKGGHLLTETEVRSQNARSADNASRYAAAMNDGAVSGKLPPGTFVASQATAGVVRSATEFLSRGSTYDSHFVHWTPRPDGVAIALSRGTLVFASVDETDTSHGGFAGTKQVFYNQDKKRLAFGGLLPSGDYIEVSSDYLVSIGVAIGRPGLPDVVARESTTTKVSGVALG